MKHEKKSKKNWLIYAGLFALVCVVLWKLTPEPQPQVREVPHVVAQKPLRLRLVHGQFDLTKKDFTVPGIPKEYLKLRSKADKDGNVRQLVQFKKPITPAMRESVTKTSGRIVGYLPDNVLIVSGPNSIVQKLATLQDVHTVTERPVWASMAPGLFKTMEAYSAGMKAQGKGEEVTLLIAGIKGEDISRELNDNGVKIITRTPASKFSFVKGTVPQLKALMPKILTTPNVAAVQVDLPKKLHSDVSEGTTNTSLATAAPITVSNINSDSIIQGGENVGDTPIWDRGLTGSGQVLLVTDSGVDADHLMYWDETLGELPSTNINLSQRKVIGYFSQLPDNGYWDINQGHGSHVAGSMVGKYEDDELTVDVYDGATAVISDVIGNEYKGMAYDAQLIVSDIGDDQGGLSVNSLSAIWNVGPNNGAGVGNNSWGTGVFFYGIRMAYSFYGAEEQEADEFFLEYPYFLSCRAAGNDGDWDVEKTVGNDAEIKNNLSVGASGNGSYNGSGNESRASFSSGGPTSDGRHRPHILAPGNRIISGKHDDTTTVSAPYNSDLHISQGTSMASPTAAGGIALIRQYFMDGHYSGGTFTPSAALLKAMVINSGVDLQGGENVGGNVPESTQGWGRLNLSNVLAFPNEEGDIGPQLALLAKDRQGPLATDKDITFTVQVISETLPLKISLAWWDAAAEPMSNPTLVNNLDLEVTAPDGTTVYLGNNFLDGYTSPGNEDANSSDGIIIPDEIHTEECVFIQEPMMGTYTIKVYGINVPKDIVEGVTTSGQQFSLVVTGGIRAAANSVAKLDKSAGKGGTGCALGLGSPWSYLPFIALGFILIGLRRRHAMN